MTFRQFTIATMLSVLGLLLAAGAAFQLGYVSMAGADDIAQVSELRSEGGPYRELYAQADTGSGSDVGDPAPSTEPKPSDKLHNPVTDPFAAIDDARGLKKNGWPILLLGVLIMLARGLGAAGERWPKLKSLIKLGGIVGTVVVAIGTVASAAFDSLVLGGSWYAVGVAAIGAVILLIHPNPKKPATS